MTADPDPDRAVVVEGVTRRFAARRRARRTEVLALDRVTLTVARGQVFGLLGPNGAGKTTLLRIVSTLLVPSEGRVTVLGHDAVRAPDVVRRRIGVVLGGERALYWRLTGRENLLYAAALHDLPPAIAREHADDLLSLVSLGERADDLVERYSTGMRHRLALARALMHSPELLVLDEPLSGLDPHGAGQMRSLLAALGRDGARTILMATHHLGDADRLCHSVAIIDRGRILAVGQPAALKARWAAEEGNGTLEGVFMALTGRPAAEGHVPGES